MLVVGACGGDGDDAGIGDVGSELDLGPGEQQPPSAGGDGGSGASPAGPGGDGSPSGPSGPGGAANPPPGGGAGPPGTGPVSADAPSPLGGPGTYAPAYLRPAPYGRVVLELISQDGARLRSASIDHSVGALRSASGKEVTVSAWTEFGDGRTSWDGDSIRAAADAHGRLRHGDGQAVMRVLALRGEFGPNDGAIGVAVRGDVMAVFVDKVRRASTPLVGGDEIEKAVTLHEVGHLLGLVDLYLSTGRQDPEHPGHSPNEESVMFWAVESDLIGQVLGDGPPTTFDEADRRDLAAIRNGA